MKPTFIKILANPDNKKDTKVYNQLLEAFGQVASGREVYHYQLGYTPTKLVNLKYEICTRFGISEKEIALYNPDQEESVDEGMVAPVKTLTPEEIQAAKDAHNTEAAARQKAQEPAVNPILANIDEGAQQGLKIRDEYPFLNEENCPDEFKVLVSDKISAYKKYAALHAEALQAADETDAEDKLYDLAKDAVKNYQLNQDIKAELDHYRDTNGKVLGKHPKMKNLKIVQEIGEMSEADLLKQRNNALKSVSKYKKAENEKMLSEWEFRLEKATGRLVNDFKHTFDKDK